MRRISLPCAAAGLALTAAFAGAHLAGVPALQVPDLKLYDLFAPPSGASSDRVVMVAVDDRLLARTGGSVQGRLARLLERLSGAGAIGLAFPVYDVVRAPVPDRVGSLVQRVQGYEIMRRDPDKPWKALPDKTPSPLFLDLAQTVHKARSEPGRAAQMNRIPGPIALPHLLQKTTNSTKKIKDRPARITIGMKTLSWVPLLKLPRNVTQTALALSSPGPWAYLIGRLPRYPCEYSIFWISPATFWVNSSLSMDRMSSPLISTSTPTSGTVIVMFLFFLALLRRSV